MSDVSMIQATLSRATEESGTVIAELLDIRRRLEGIRRQVGQVAEGSQNATLQEALVGLAQSEPVLDEEVRRISRAGDRLIEYFNQL